MKRMTGKTEHYATVPAGYIGTCHHCPTRIYASDHYISVRGPTQPATLICLRCNARILAQIDADRAKRAVARHG